ncbi:MAG: aminodeoxychorismate synthase component I, partial [Flavobacteriaceae bacterium CG_4_8_14_3_um_filter_31_8]
MMQRTISSFSIKDVAKFKQQLLIWAQQFETAIFLDSNNYQQQYSSFDVALAVEEFTSIKTDVHNAFQKLQEYQSNI